MSNGVRFILSIIIIFLLILFQASAYPYLEIYRAFPNLILIVVLILSVLRNYKKNWIWIIFGGFLLDIYSFDNLIGTSILGLFLISYLTYYFSQNIFKKPSIYSIILIGAGGTLIYRLFIILIFLIADINFQLSFKQAIFQVVYNLIILIPLFYLLKYLWKKKTLINIK